MRGVYPLRGRESYRVVICPPDNANTRSVRLRELPDQVHVRPTGTHALPGRWEFEVFLPTDDVWIRPARLFYDVETADGTLTGEIHLAIHPPPLKRWRIAVILGAAVTLQSAGLLLGMLLGTDLKWDDVLLRINPLNRLERAQFWFLFSIPASWTGLWLIDRLQYRWQA